jgi:DNA-binding response OmpR family regulator
LSRVFAGSPEDELNLGNARILLVYDNPRSMDILSGILLGFGARMIHRAPSIGDAQNMLRSRPFELVIADCDVAGSDGFDLVHWLRRSELEDNAFTPVILVTGHTQLTKVKKARDSGASFIVAKPVTPSVLLERILWVAHDPRSFVEVGAYIGPDRRHKLVGPPPGMTDRRDAAPLDSRAAS